MLYSIYIILEMIYRFYNPCHNLFVKSIYKRTYFENSNEMKIIDISLILKND